MAFPGPPRLEQGVRLRRLLAVEGPFAWWEATLVADGSRRVAVVCDRAITAAPVGVGPALAPSEAEQPAFEVGSWPAGFVPLAAGIALSAPVQVLLEEWLPCPGEVAFDADELLVARLAALFAAAATDREGEHSAFSLPLGAGVAPVGTASPLPDGESAGDATCGGDATECVPEFANEADLALAARIFLAEGQWWACGRLQGPAVGRLITLFAPADPLQIAGLFASGAPADVSRQLVSAWATHLAGERHVIVRRTSRDVVAHVASQLLAVASRLWRAVPPPVAANGAVISASGRVKLASGEVVFGGGRLEVRPTRAAVRALTEAQDPAASALRRWLVGMSTLRVEREMLRRR